MKDMQKFAYLLRPARPGMVNDPTAEERQIAREHFAYLEAATQAGMVLMAGRSTGLPDIFGICVFVAEDEAAARAFMENDPGVKGGIHLAMLYPFRVSLWNAAWGKA